MQDLNDLYYYAMVAEHGGFAAAARAMGVPKSKLSRRVALLEERLGLRLIQRSSRRFAITEIGREYHARCLAVLVEAEAAEQVIAEVRSGPRGLLRLACPVALLSFQFGALLARFMAENRDRPSAGEHQPPRRRHCRALRHCHPRPLSAA